MPFTEMGLSDPLLRGVLASGYITPTGIQSQVILAALDGFKQGKYQVMVATDIVARGIDVRGISHIINFDVPLFAQDYVHRIGRTGRACATGDAITFVAPDEHDQLRRIERFIGCQLALDEYESFTCAQFTATLSRSEAQSRAQRQVARVRKAAKKPRLVRRRGFASAR